MKRVLAIILIAMTLVSVAMADSASVTYVGGAENFIFLPSNEYSDTDLFNDFKNVMPGDVLTENIRVQNDNMYRVRIYMRAEGCTEEDQDFLNQLKLNVKTTKGEIFDAQADETAQLTDWVPIGVLKQKSKTNLNVTLTVPTDLDNRYMGRIGTLAWSFMVEIIDDGKNPETGDWFDGTVWIGCALAVLATGICVMIISRKRTRVK